MTDTREAEMLARLKATKKNLRQLRTEYGVDALLAALLKFVKVFMAKRGYANREAVEAALRANSSAVPPDVATALDLIFHLKNQFE